jgi:hypothetical protein
MKETLLPVQLDKPEAEGVTRSEVNTGLGFKRS